MAAPLRMGRMLLNQHVRAGASGQHLLGLLSDASDQPSTSGSSSASPTFPYLHSASGFAASGATAAWHQQRHLSFWSKAAPAAPGNVASLSGGGDAVSDQAQEAAAVGFFPLREDSLEVLNAISVACDAIEKASIAAAKADAWFAASWVISAIQMAHETLGTPWWATIAIFNISLRCMTFPLMILAQKASAKMVLFNHALLRAKALQEASTRATNPEEQARLFKSFQAEYNGVTAKHGNPMKTAMTLPFILIFNGVVFLSIFSGISKLMNAKVPSLTTGGTFTFTDLTVPDPYYILPVTCTMVTLAMIEYGLALTADTGMPPDKAAMTQKMKWVFRVMALMFIPAGMYVPAGTAMLWTSNTAFGVVQGVVLRSDPFRKTVGLPTMQEMKDMNAQVQAANATDPALGPAGTPPPPGSAPNAETGPKVLYDFSPKGHPIKH